MFWNTVQVLVLAFLTVFALHLLLQLVGQHIGGVVHETFDSNGTGTGTGHNGTGHTGNTTNPVGGYVGRDVEAEAEAEAEEPARHRTRRGKRRASGSRASGSPAVPPPPAAPEYTSMEDELKAWMRRETTSWAGESAPATGEAAASAAVAGTANTSADGQSATSIDALFASKQPELDAHIDDTTGTMPSQAVQLQVATLPATRSTSTKQAVQAPGTGIPTTACDGSGYTNVMNADRGMSGGLQAFDTAMGSFAAF